MKKPKFYIVVFSFSILALVALHFTLVFCGCAPDQLVSENCKTYSKKYLDPLFSQSWSLFVPAPSHQKEVFIGTTDREGKTKYKILNPEFFHGRKRFYYFTMLFHSLNDLRYYPENEKGIVKVTKESFFSIAMSKMLASECVNENEELTHLVTLVKNLNSTIKSEKVITVIYKWPKHNL